MEKFYKDLENLDLIVSRDIDKIDTLKRLINGIKVPKVSSKNKELNQVVEDIRSNFEIIVGSWKREVNKLIAEFEFSEYLRNKFIVIVYGKVKAGKSTLGNFVANNEVTKKLNKKAKFFIYESNSKKSIDKLEEFKTDNLECTSEIQGFELDSLAWIDTPGLLSVTKQNEELAKKYINAADFIIFPTSSDSPLQNEEIKELKELQKYNKKFSVVITKSDYVEEDEVDGEIVNVFHNKSNEVRKEQEEWVKNRLKEEGIDVEDVFSISVKMAKLGDLEGSNMLKFFEFMDKSVVRKADLLKETSQKDRIKGFITNDILSKIKTLEEGLNRLKKEQIKIKEKINRKITLSKSDAVFIMTNLINISEINRYNIKDKFLEIQKRAYKELEEKLKRDIEEIFSGFEREFGEFMEIVDVDEFEVKDKYKKVKVVVTTYKKAAQTAGAVIGGIVGGMFGGPLGAAAGAMIGGYVGGEVVGVDEYIENIKIGDSTIEEVQKFKEKMQKSLQKSIERFYKEVDKSVSKEIENIITSLQKEINYIKGSLDV
jgi:tRNA U34 5-carboxymethylaminomethyl modifying GTPase MnmE/TrmE